MLVCGLTVSTRGRGSAAAFGKGAWGLAHLLLRGSRGAGRPQPAHPWRKLTPRPSARYELHLAAIAQQGPALPIWLYHIGKSRPIVDFAFYCFIASMLSLF